MAYRPPISRGYDAIGEAVGGALAAGSRSIADSFAERRRRELEDEERARRDRLDRLAMEDRERQIAAEQRRTAIENAEIGVIDQREALNGDPIERAVTGADGRVQVGQGSIIRPNDQAPTLREGVVRAGEVYIDPSRSLATRRRQIEREETRAEQNRQIEEVADRYQKLDPTMSRGDAIARAAGLSTADPITFEGALDQRKQIGRVEEEFDVRREGRSNAEWTRREGIEANRSRTTLGRERTANAAEGLALTLADQAFKFQDEVEAGKRRWGPGADPLSYVRSALRTQVQRQGLNLSEGEIQELALRAVYSVQDQRSQHAPDEDDWGTDPGGDIDLNTPRSGGANSPDRSELLAAQREWDEDYRDAQQISDPRKRAEAMRLIGQRPR